MRQSTNLRDVHPVTVTESRFNPDNWSVHPEHHSIIKVLVIVASSETFADFVSTLNTWEIDVLRMTTMQVDPIASCDALSHGLRVASDGLVRFTTQGAFGWALSTGPRITGNNRHGTSAGPTTLIVPDRGIRVISILRFLIRIAEFTGRQDAWRGILLTDSQCVLKTLGGGDKPFDANFNLLVSIEQPSS